MKTFAYIGLCAGLLLGCGDQDPEVDTGDVGDTTQQDDTNNSSTPDTEDTGEPVAPTQAVIEGVVRVQLYTEDKEGERTYVSWSDTYNGAYPFGSIFLTTFTEGEFGDIDYHGSTAVPAAKVTPESGNAYSITVNLTQKGTVNLYACLLYTSDAADD